MGVWLAVRIRQGLSPSSHEACEIEETQTFGDLSMRFVEEDKTIERIELTSSKSKFKMDVKTTTPISVCNQFGAFTVDIFIRVNGEEAAVNNSAEKCAFSMMMQRANTRGRPSKIDPAKNSVDEIYNDLLDLIADLGIDWSASVIDSTGKEFVKSLRDLIWHITLHHDKFTSRAATLPKFVTNKFSNRNNFMGKKQAKSDFQLSETKLRKYISDLSNFLSQPWMSKHKSFRTDIVTLVEACQKMANYLKQCNSMVQQRQKSVSTHSSDDVEIVIRQRCSGEILKIFLKFKARNDGTIKFYNPID